MSWQRLENGDVQLTMSKDDWQRLLLVLGYAAGAAHKVGAWDAARPMIALTNRLNEGNPEFRPYDLGPEPEERT
jgi:hypothetical protein